MNALFEIGQKVVCVNSKGADPRVIEGKKYTIEAIRQFKCCGHIAVDVGVIINPVHYTHLLDCPCGAEVPHNGVAWYKQTRFVPLDFDRQADEAIHEALKEDLKVKNFQDN